MEQLSLEQQEKLERLRLHSGFLKSFLIEKSRIIPTIASLSATVLIIATFNDNLLPISYGTKLALSILLALIPLSLIISVFEFHLAANGSRKSMEDIVGKVELPPRDKWYQTWFDGILVYYPFVGVFVLTGVIIYIIISIW